MENATKALRISAGIFLGLLIVSLCVYMYTQISSYYQSKSDSKVEETVRQFNSEYDVYFKSTVKGNEIITLINKVIDYNNRNADSESSKITLEIDFGGKDINSLISYDGLSSTYSNNVTSVLKSVGMLTNKNSNTSLSYVNQMSNGFSYTSSQLQKMVNYIHKIFDVYNYSDGTSDANKAKETRDEFVETVIGTKYSDLNQDKQKELEQNVLRYYQFQEFKKLKFKYVTAEYGQTGKINYMKFELKD